MNAEELAADYRRLASMARERMVTNFAAGEAVVAWEQAAMLLETNFTPNPLHDAAADMLAALEAWVEAQDNDKTEYDDIQPILSAARAVIAKAKSAAQPEEPGHE